MTVIAFSFPLQQQLFSINTIIISPIEAHLLSSPSISSKIKVAAVPAITAKATRNQNNLFNFLSFSLFSAAFIDGSATGLSDTGSDFSVSGISTESSFIDSFLESLGPRVGLDFFLFEFCQLNF